MNQREQPFADWVSVQLDDGRSELVNDWIRALQSDVGRRLPRQLPEVALRNHIPPVLAAVAEALRTPLRAANQEMLNHLKLHAQMRRAQGYDVQELLSEFDDLSDRVGQFIGQRLRETETEADAADVLDVMARLSTLLRGIGFVTVGVYRDLEEDERSQLAAHLETFGRALAHELRTPLSTVQLGLDTLRGGVDEDDGGRVERSLDTMERALARSQELLNDIRILALSKGRDPSARQRIGSIAHDVVRELSLQAEQQGVEIRNGVEDIDALIDQTVGQLALINLVSNGIKYTDREKEDRWVQLDAKLVDDEAQGNMLVIEVSDNGVGIPKEVVEKVFRRHFRAHPELATGVGLGLAITRQVVEQSGGRIDLKSEAGRGTTFSVRLPAFGPAASAHLDPHAVLQNSAEVGGAEEDSAGAGARDEAPAPPPGSKAS